VSAIGVRVRGGVAWLTAGRGGDDGRVASELNGRVEDLRFDERVAVVVLSSQRDEFFFAAATAAQEVANVVAAVAALSQPVIGVIGGAAVGDGAALALACDLRLAARRSFFRFPHLAAGLLPGCGVTQRLPRLVGRMRALDLLLSGRRLGSAEALRVGLLSEVAGTGLATVARRRARDLAAKGPIALRYAKEAVVQGMDLTLAQGIRLEQDLYVLLQTTVDRAEGVRAFRARRAPRYQGR
jgi:enoyl-CoA hydratase/carnithine racemase